MKISDIFPFDDEDSIGDKIVSSLSSWLYNEVHLQKNFDIHALPSAIQVMKAFSALEREGTLAAFEKELYRGP